MAPSNTAAQMETGIACGGACAASVLAARSATMRAVACAGSGRMHRHKLCERTAPIHRRSVIQPVAARPTMRQGLTRALTFSADSLSKPYRPNAHAIADAV